MARAIRAHCLASGQSPAEIALIIHSQCGPAFGTTLVRAHRLALGIALADVVAQVRARYVSEGRTPPRFSETLLSSYEGGQKRPGPEYLHYLCCVYQAEPADLGYEGPCLCGQRHRAPVLMLSGPAHAAPQEPGRPGGPGHARPRPARRRKERAADTHRSPFPGRERRRRSPGSAAPEAGIAGRDRARPHAIACAGAGPRRAGVTGPGRRPRPPPRHRRLPPPARPPPALARINTRPISTGPISAGPIGSGGRRPGPHRPGRVPGWPDWLRAWPGWAWPGRAWPGRAWPDRPAWPGCSLAGRPRALPPRSPPAPPR